MIKYSRYSYVYRNQSWTANWYLKRDVDQLIEQWSALPEPRDSVVRRAFYAQRRNDLQVREKVRWRSCWRLLF